MLLHLFSQSDGFLHTGRGYSTIGKFTSQTGSAAGKKKKVSNATIVLREREARKAARETELARKKAVSAAATAKEEEALRQAKLRQYGLLISSQ